MRLMTCELLTLSACCVPCIPRRASSSGRKRAPSAARTSGKPGFCASHAEGCASRKTELQIILRRRKQRCRPGSLPIAEAHLLQSRVYLKQQRLDLARQDAEACVDLRRKALTTQHPAVAEALVGAQFGRCISATMSAVNAAAKTQGAALCTGYAEVLLAAGDQTAAKVQAKKALSLHKQTLGDNHPSTIAAATLLTSCSSSPLESMKC